jgi:hypothetical protein
MTNNFQCERTGIQVYKCEAERKNLNTRGRDNNVVVFTGLRYLTEITKGYESRVDVNFQGQKWSRIFKMLLEPQDLFIFNHGYKVRYNMTNQYKNAAYIPNLKPFTFDLNLVDNWELEIHEIKTLYDGCNTYGVAYLISYN